MQDFGNQRLWFKLLFAKNVEVKSFIRRKENSITVEHVVIHVQCSTPRLFISNLMHWDKQEETPSFQWEESGEKKVPRKDQQGRLVRKEFLL